MESDIARRISALGRCSVFHVRSQPASRRAAIAVAGTALAAAGPVDVSGLSPFASCTVGGPGTNFVNSEVEPFVAVNPANPSTIVGVFQQDRWSNGGAHGLVASTSHDGGATWSESWAHFSICSGGTAANGGNYDRASDPWVTFASNGHVYQISLSASADLTVSAVLVSKSVDGGDTWSEDGSANISALPRTGLATRSRSRPAEWRQRPLSGTEAASSDNAGLTAQMNAAPLAATSSSAHDQRRPDVEAARHPGTDQNEF